MNALHLNKLLVEVNGMKFLVVSVLKKNALQITTLIAVIIHRTMWPLWPVQHNAGFQTFLILSVLQTKFPLNSTILVKG